MHLESEGIQSTWSVSSLHYAGSQVNTHTVIIDRYIVRYTHTYTH